MKKQLFAVVMVVAVLAFGNAFAQKGTPEQRAERMTQRMKTDLGLTDAQAAQIGPLNLEKVKKQEEWKSQIQTGDKKGIHRDRKAFLDSFETRLKVILTPEQFTKYSQQQEERKSDFDTKRKDKKSEQ
ncbi:MAG: DUF4890 domain-containing protein [Spirosomataceae bacterium]